jgi:hypothetical protein
VPPSTKTAHPVPGYTTRPGPGPGGADCFAEDEPQPTAITARTRRPASFATPEA